MLVSVRSEQEAIDAIAGGADIIDIKEPSRGSLGRADSSIVQAIARLAREADRPVTAAMGEWDHTEGRDRWLRECLPLLTLVKVGLAGIDASPNGREWFRKLTQSIVAVSASSGARLVATAYADHERCRAPSINQVLDWAEEETLPVLLVDTFTKDGKGFWDWLSPEAYGRLRSTCRDRRIALAVAGSLTPDAVDRFTSDPPDVIAVRGAACGGRQRDGSIDPANVRGLKRLLLG